MNYEIMDTWFIQSAEEQHLSLTADGNEYYLCILSKSDEYRTKDGDLDMAFSGRFKKNDEAIEAYLKCVKDFGRGWHSWEQRKEMVRKLGTPRH